MLNLRFLRCKMFGNNFLLKFKPHKVMENITGISYLLVVQINLFADFHTEVKALGRNI